MGFKVYVKNIIIVTSLNPIIRIIIYMTYVEKLIIQLTALTMIENIKTLRNSKG